MNKRSGSGNKRAKTANNRNAAAPVAAAFLARALGRHSNIPNDLLGLLSSCWRRLFTFAQLISYHDF
jgi:hypothetical protein